jgi:hypothetical protein
MIKIFQVSLIYRDKSLGNSLQLSVVRIIILEESESFAPPTMDENARISASDMLKLFCKWQTYINGFDKKSGKSEYDVALLLTRL